MNYKLQDIGGGRFDYVPFEKWTSKVPVAKPVAPKVPWCSGLVDFFYCDFIDTAARRIVNLLLCWLWAVLWAAGGYFFMGGGMFPRLAMWLSGILTAVFFLGGIAALFGFMEEEDKEVAIW